MASWAIARPYGNLGGVDHLDVRRQLGEQLLRRQPVGDDDVGLGQQPPPAHGDQLGIAGPAADQRDAAVDPSGVSAVITPCCRASWIADRMAAERRCSPPASTPTDSPSYSNDAGVTAVPSRATSARTQKILAALGLGDDGRVDVRVVGGRDRVPGAVEVAVAEVAQRPA